MIVVLFTVPFDRFLFLRYLVLAERHVSSDILAPFPDLRDLCNRENGVSKIVTYYSLALFLLIEGSYMWSNQFWFDLKLGS